jgi:hypothetical protein
MARGWGAQQGLWVADHALLAGGLTLLLAGVTLLPLVLPLAWLALALAFLTWFAEVEGFALPRPGRARIHTYGCWDIPLAFSVRHQGKTLLFTREDVPDGWAPDYTVRALLSAGHVEPHWELPLPEGVAFPVLGRTPVRGLRFEHHERISYVSRRTLVRALGQLSSAARRRGQVLN